MPEKDAIKLPPELSEMVREAAGGANRLEFAKNFQVFKMFFLVSGASDH